MNKNTLLSSKEIREMMIGAVREIYENTYYFKFMKQYKHERECSKLGVGKEKEIT